MKELSLNILDIVQNSVRAKADRISIEITESQLRDQYSICISDNGTGIPEEILKDVTNPFVTTRTKRRMGLGLALLKHHAELTGGNLEIGTSQGKGTSVTAHLSYRHIDRQPLGDIAGVLIMLIATNEGIEFTYFHSTEEGQYKFSTKETKEFLEIETLSDRILLEEIRCMVIENLKEINASGIEKSKESLEAFMKS